MDVQACEWCSRPGAALDMTMHRNGRITLKDPVLCDVCAALVGFASGGGADADERREEAIEAVVSELETRQANGVRRK